MIWILFSTLATFLCTEISLCSCSVLCCTCSLLGKLEEKLENRQWMRTSNFIRITTWSALVVFQILYLIRILFLLDNPLCSKKFGSFMLTSIQNRVFLKIWKLEILFVSKQKKSLLILRTKWLYSKLKSAKGWSLW